MKSTIESKSAGKKFIKYTLVENPVASSNRVSDCYRPIKAIVTGERQRAAAVAVHERVAKFL
ncbi:unnamed protein product [Neisseria lactamica Y92-1009]|nr:unnamed protein product [Neisseria lactamica Y92-1009]